MRFLAGLMIAALSVTNAMAADLVYRAAPAGHFYGLLHPALPDCTEPAVLNDIARKFGVYDANIIHSGLAITGFDAVRQTGTKDGPSLVDVRYCSGRALLSNGRASEVVFIIEGPMKGKYSIGYAVESCLPGFDPYRVYDGDCRSIRPS